jgi:prepilin-type N-terminal cleavage/methylation domain-containing protein
MSPRSDRGFTLIELLLVMSMALVILGATLTSFTTFYRKDKQSQTLNDTAQIARNAMDVAARQLRNLANQDPSQATTTILQALPNDLVFQTSDPSRKWVRYCLDTAGGGGQPTTTSRGMLWESETATAAAPSGAMLDSCPGAMGAGGWVTRRVVADRVMNHAFGRLLPVFDYSCASSAGAACPAGSLDYPRITNIGAQLYVDPNPGRAPAELRVATGIFLRNQNEKPASQFTATPVAPPSRTVILNGSASTDPEGRTLAYDWFRGAGTVTLTPAEACALSISQKANGGSLIYLGQGTTYRYTVPAGVASPMNIQLVVRDPGCLYNTKVDSVPIP